MHSQQQQQPLIYARPPSRSGFANAGSGYVDGKQSGDFKPVRPASPAYSSSSSSSSSNGGAVRPVSAAYRGINVNAGMLPSAGTPSRPLQLGLNALADLVQSSGGIHLDSCADDNGAISCSQPMTTSYEGLLNAMDSMLSATGHRVTGGDDTVYIQALKNDIFKLQMKHEKITQAQPAASSIGASGARPMTARSRRHADIEQTSKFTAAVDALCDSRMTTREQKLKLWEYLSERMIHLCAITLQQTDSAAGGSKIQELSQQLQQQQQQQQVCHMSSGAHESCIPLTHRCQLVVTCRPHHPCHTCRGY